MCPVPTTCPPPGVTYLVNCPGLLRAVPGAQRHPPVLGCCYSESLGSFCSSSLSPASRKHSFCFPWVTQRDSHSGNCRHSVIFSSSISCPGLCRDTDGSGLQWGGPTPRHQNYLGEATGPPSFCGSGFLFSVWFLLKTSSFPEEISCWSSFEALNVLVCAFLLVASVYSPEGISAGVPVRSHEVVSVVWRKASPPSTARERRLEVVGRAFSP